ncbi:MAG: aldolase [Clostridia bacterium]|nr:aldolase [Clostridia bacterium]
MPITLMYITNDVRLAKIAQEAGVDRVWIDMEYKGKEERQAGMNTVKSNHTVEDVKKLRPVVTSSSLQVRVNPLDECSKKEIDEVIAAGADYVMLPMFKTRDDVEKFISLVGGRAKTILLLETREAAENIEEYIDMPGIDEIHIGLNDLHLAYGKTFMFELIVDGTVERLAKILREHNVRFGFGGMARIGYGMLPAEKILTQHYAWGSQMAILSRGFCDANLVSDPETVRDDFIVGVQKIRAKEKEIERYTDADFAANYAEIGPIVSSIVENIKAKRAGK